MSAEPGTAPTGLTTARGTWQARVGHPVRYGMRDPARYPAGVEALIADVGPRPVRDGGLDTADVADRFARLWFALAFGKGRGRQHGLRVLDRR